MSLSILRDVTLKVRPPRALYLRWPFGHPLGEPGNIAQQFTVLHEAFQFLYIAVPGELRDLPYRWRRETYSIPAAWAGLHSDLGPKGEKEYERSKAPKRPDSCDG